MPTPMLLFQALPFLRPTWAELCPHLTKTHVDFSPLHLPKLAELSYVAVRN